MKPSSFGHESYDDTSECVASDDRAMKNAPEIERQSAGRRTAVILPLAARNDKGQAGGDRQLWIKKGRGGVNGDSPHCSCHSMPRVTKCG